jgi:hypothetical protein
MPRSKAIHFHATKRDLESLLTAVESQRPLKYTQAGMFDSAEIPTYTSCLAIASLGCAPSGESIGEPFWLITDADATVSIKTVPQHRGGVRYGVDPGLKPESVVLWPGGVFEGHIKWRGGEFNGGAVIDGQIATAMFNPTSMELMNLFAREAKRQFKRIKSFFVGPQAEQLFDAGYRLAHSIKSPRECDLSRN